MGFGVCILYLTAQLDRKHTREKGMTARKATTGVYIDKIIHKLYLHKQMMDSNALLFIIYHSFVTCLDLFIHAVVSIISVS